MIDRHGNTISVGDRVRLLNAGLPPAKMLTGTVRRFSCDQVEVSDGTDAEYRSAEHTWATWAKVGDVERATEAPAFNHRDHNGRPISVGDRVRLLEMEMTGTVISTSRSYCVEVGSGSGKWHTWAGNVERIEAPPPPRDRAYLASLIMAEAAMLEAWADRFEKQGIAVTSGELRRRAIELRREARHVA